MSKLSQLALESQREEIAFNNSQYNQEKSFLDYTIRDVLTFMAEITIGLFVVFVLWLFIILVLI